MIGAEGVAIAVIEAVKPQYDLRLVALRTRLGINDTVLPDIREWRTWTDGRVPEGADTTRMPCIEIAIPIETQFVSFAMDTGPNNGDMYAYDYSIKAYIISIGNDWEQAEMMRRRYSLAMRESILALGATNDLGIVFDATKVHTEHFNADPVATGNVRSESQVTFVVRAYEELSFDPLGVVQSTLIITQRLP